MVDRLPGERRGRESAQKAEERTSQAATHEKSSGKRPLVCGEGVANPKDDVR